MYERDPRVFSVLGPGGTGKTRFALELCRLLAEDADGGTVFCALAPVREPDLVLATIAERLGATSPEVGAISARVGEKRTHVLVDNLEHLLPDAAGQLAELIEAAPALRLVVTSREALRIQGETELDLPPLSESEAVALFIARARAVRPDLEEDDAVGALCARLDRLPLALELAASRTKLLAPKALLARLGESLDLLKGTRDADARHTTLRATIAWSYDLLDSDEQRLFRRLAAFRGGSTLETAEAVCEADLDTLASLLDKSLVRRRTGRLGEERYWMLETIREFATGAARGVATKRDGIRRRHAERMLEIADSAHLTEDDDEQFRLPLVLAEEQDMRAAVDWASDDDARARTQTRRLSRELLERPRSPRDVLRRMDLLPRGRRCSDRSCGPPRSVSAAVRSTSTASSRAATSRTRRACALPRARGRARDCGDPATPREQRVSTASELRAISRSRRGVARARAGTIPVHRDRQHHACSDGSTSTPATSRPAPSSFASPPTWRPTSDWHWWRAGALASLAILEVERDDLDEAEEDSREALQLIRPDESRLGTFTPLTAIARVALARDDPRRAGVLWGAVDAETERSPSRIWQRWRPERAGPLLDEASLEFLSSVDIGRQLDLWDAVGIALGELELPQIEP